MSRELWSGYAIVTGLIFLAGVWLGTAVDSPTAASPANCVVESHYLTQPFDGGTAHDGRTTYTGACNIVTE